MKFFDRKDKVEKLRAIRAKSAKEAQFTVGAGEGLKGDGGGSVDVLCALFVLLDVADVDAGTGGEFALRKSGGETLAAEALLVEGAVCANGMFGVRQTHIMNAYNMRPCTKGKECIMKEIMCLMAGLALVTGAGATTIVEITQAAPGAAGLSGEAMANYDCFIVRGGTLGKAMGRTPETSQAGVEEVVAYLNADFAANYQTLLAGSYDMLRDANRNDFRNSGGLSFGERFGLVVYNPADGTKAGVENIAYYRVFNLDNLSVINDSKPNAGYWSGWQTGSAVPEPTSALLFVLGVAGLALRRRRM